MNDIIKKNQELVNKLLVFIRIKNLENYNTPLHFKENDADAKEFMQQHNENYKAVSNALNTCYKAGYFNKAGIPVNFSGHPYFMAVSLTREGLEKAEELSNPGQTSQGIVVVGDGNIIGNNNIKIENFFNYLINEINKSSADEAEKKGLIAKIESIMNSPFVCSIVNGLASGLSSNLK
ncbi:MAG: hypothetical protein QM529_05665 [Hydrotalea sp.]|nr:hypothetical protein [Hydrotalea sp.]